MYRLIISSILALLPFVSSAQKNVRTIEGEYTYYAPSTVTPEEAQRTAVERARVTALAEAFGTYVYQSNRTTLQHGELDFKSTGGSEVKGEWIDDLDKPEVEVIGFEQNMLVVRARVRGRAREIVAAPIDFQAKLLRNGTEPKYESDEFRAGDDFHLWFKTPVSGHLAVYLVDNDDMAFCLLPYENDDSGRFAVRNDREYLFFSEKHADTSMRPLVDEYMLTCDRTVEHNVVYIIFSPEEFSKADDAASTSTAYVRPRQLPFDSFREWLAKSRIHDPKMVVEQKVITIRK